MSCGLPPVSLIEASILCVLEGNRTCPAPYYILPSRSLRIEDIADSGDEMSRETKTEED
jgi:hypothetical protein